MKLSRFDHLNCPIAATLGVVGEHWSLLIIRDAVAGVRRFDDFQRSLGIARNVLTSRLKRLVAEGVLERYRGDRGRYEYRPTRAGLDLYPVLVALVQWGEQHRPHPRGPRITLVDRRHGRPIAPLAPRSSTGRKLEPSEVRIQPGPALAARARPTRI